MISQQRLSWAELDLLVQPHIRRSSDVWDLRPDRCFCVCDLMMNAGDEGLALRTWQTRTKPACLCESAIISSGVSDLSEKHTQTEGKRYMDLISNLRGADASQTQSLFLRLMRNYSWRCKHLADTLKYSFNKNPEIWTTPLCSVK